VQSLHDSIHLRGRRLQEEISEAHDVDECDVALRGDGPFGYEFNRIAAASKRLGSGFSGDGGRGGYGERDFSYGGLEPIDSAVDSWVNGGDRNDQLSHGTEFGECGSGFCGAAVWGAGVGCVGRDFVRGAISIAGNAAAEVHCL